MKLHWPLKLKTILLHCLFWVLIVFYFAWGFGFSTNPKLSFLNATFFLPGFLFMVYSLLYFLVPRYLIQRKYFKFFIGLIIVLAACTTYGMVAQVTLMTNEKFKGFDIRTGRAILPFLHVAGFAVSIQLLGYWFNQKQQTMEAQQQATIAELQLLKSQLHPHFLFNTLNNLYSHTLSQSPTAPEIVLKLSDVLRFIIYESNSTTISLVKEINLLQQYIALEKLRYGDRLDMSMVVKGDLARFHIAPLLLLPFLENAFKHGASKQIDQCWISFDLAIN
ncbi:MAG: histidine kinase, partial [Aquaticitalea sp.]